MFLHQLDTILSAHSPSPPLQKAEEKYIAAKKKTIQELQNLLTRTQRIIVFDLKPKETVSIPEEFFDLIHAALMKDPYRHRRKEAASQVLDYMSWKKAFPKNPFDNKPFKLEDLLPDQELRAKIEEFCEKHPDLPEVKELRNREKS